MKTRNFLTTLLLALPVFGCASNDPLPAIDPAAVVPETLRPAANEALAMIVPAKGVQIYECRAAKDRPDRYQWAFVAPEADLFDTRGRPIGRHYAGPHWEATDGSRIVANVIARADSPATGTIPWLLLSARSVGGAGAFSAVASIQRLNTVGGAAPINGCSQATTGKQERIEYTADYYFFAAR